MGTRKDFERYVKNKFPNLILSTNTEGKYDSTAVQHMWETWMEARREMASDIRHSAQLMGHVERAAVGFLLSQSEV